MVAKNRISASLLQLLAAAQLLAIAQATAANETIAREPKQILKINWNSSETDYIEPTRTRVTLSGSSLRGNKPSDAVFGLSPDRLVMVQPRPTPKPTLTITFKDVHRGQPDSRCPRYGVKSLEHPTACDKYLLCRDGYLSEHTCPNGLMYGAHDTVVDFCVHRWQAVCAEKSIPNPVSSPGCRWQYGLFQVQGSPKCSAAYYECRAGKFRVRRCDQPGHLFDDRSKSCKPAAVVGCRDDEQRAANFRCPPDDQKNPFWPFPRYFLDERSLVHCVNERPELISCAEGERVDPDYLHCSPLEKLAHLYGPHVGLVEAKLRPLE